MLRAIPRPRRLRPPLPLSSRRRRRRRARLGAPPAQVLLEVGVPRDGVERGGHLPTERLLLLLVHRRMLLVQDASGIVEMMMTDVLTVPVLRVRVLEHDALDDDAVLVRRRELLGCVGPVPRGRRPRRDARPGAAADGHGATRGDEPRSAAERERATTRAGAAVAARAVGRRGPRRRGRRGSRDGHGARERRAHPPALASTRATDAIRATCAEFARGGCQKLTARAGECARAARARRGMRLSASTSRSACFQRGHSRASVDRRRARTLRGVGCGAASGTPKRFVNGDGTGDRYGLDRSRQI